jgi:4-diphosphocytidyl-2-C-methyl-D-erythritol kinase
MSTSDITTEHGLELVAPAKVNLVLEVVGRREDGYHDLDTVIVTIDLVDSVRLIPADELEVRLSGPLAAGIDAGDELAGRAARALASAAGRTPDVRIEIAKRVPVAAGLGGGSSDAGAVLRGLNRLWGLDWPAERLTPLAASLGSDVPFFLHGGAARCRGRGELVEPLRDPRPMRLLLLLPPVPQPADKTARRFRALRPADFSDGEHAHRVAHRIERNAPPPTTDLVNAFEAVIERTESELLAHYGAYRATGAPRLHLTGSGPTAFLLVHEDAKASELRRDFESAGARVFVTRTLPRNEALAVRALGGGNAAS